MKNAGTHSQPTTSAELSTGIATSARRLLALLAIMLAATGAMTAQSALAQLPDGGTAYVTANCFPNIGTNNAWIQTFSSSGYTVFYHVYIYAANNPEISDWTPGWNQIQPGGHATVGNIARSGIGPVAFMVEYAWSDGYKWNYNREWLLFPQTNSYYCSI